MSDFNLQGGRCNISFIGIPLSHCVTMIHTPLSLRWEVLRYLLSNLRWWIDEFRQDWAMDIEYSLFNTDGLEMSRLVFTRL